MKRNFKIGQKFRYNVRDDIYRELTITGFEKLGKLEVVVFMNESHNCEIRYPKKQIRKSIRKGHLIPTDPISVEYIQEIP